MSKTSLERELPDVGFFGLLEITAFLMLFVSPVLAQTSGRLAWLSVAFLRVIVLGVAILPTRAVAVGPARGVTVKAALGFLGRGCLYQMPFWMSAIFFPLHAGQTEFALLALGVQCGLLLLVLVLSRWRAFSAESLVYLLSGVWSLLNFASSWPVFWWVGCLGFPFTLRGRWSRRDWGWEFNASHCLAIGLAWLALFPLRSLCPSVMASTLEPLFFWLLLVHLGAVLSLSQREILGMGEEAEFPAPQACSARGWMMRRRSATVAVGWWSLLFFQVGRPVEVFAVLALGIAWLRGSRVAAGSSYSGEKVAWWVTSEAFLLWCICRTPWPDTALWVALSLLFLGLGRNRSPSSVDAFPVVELGRVELESLLRTRLRLPAPAGFSARTLRESGPAELDQELTSSAPVGFRKRLLERLRQDGDSGEV